jgi:hypothetical protein
MGGIAPESSYAFLLEFFSTNSVEINSVDCLLLDFEKLIDLLFSENEGVYH